MGEVFDKNRTEGKNSILWGRKSLIHRVRGDLAGTPRDSTTVLEQKLEIKLERQGKDMQQVMHQNKKKGTVAFSYSYGII
ncbi:hypothetical protein QUW63_11935 [Pseudoflavonifractor phocaeensis]|uniref:hypothetical protein n=1 Tax=Pseudoflavonifractor phocaeensis TaxID=1870988 RepID=UPI0025A32FBD|nr:hypothetical protein [Pseudoflavonifractor phocaeensis]MDM8239800.1 hypothetical protein [Pseudoflavonifractor phocaeensis]